MRDLCLWNGYGMVMDNSSTQSLKHLALGFGRWQEWNADS